MNSNVESEMKTKQPKSNTLVERRPYEKPVLVEIAKAHGTAGKFYAPGETTSIYSANSGPS